MKIEIIKIWATGYKRFMFYGINNIQKCSRIDEETYQYLKKQGIPTSQSLRKK